MVTPPDSIGYIGDKDKGKLGDIDVGIGEFMIGHGTEPLLKPIPNILQTNCSRRILTIILLETYIGIGSREII